MTSKERVLIALSHREADMVPLDIGAINNTSFHTVVSKKLKAHFGLPDTDDDIRSVNCGVVVPDDALLDLLGSDCRSVYFPELPFSYDGESGLYTDQWGITYKKDDNGYFYDFVDHPLKNAKEIADLDLSYLPAPDAAFRLSDLKETIARHKGDKCLVLEGFRECLFGLPTWLRGYENFYSDLALDEDEGLASALCDRLLDYHKQVAAFILGEIGEHIDVVKVADDLGTQNGTLISPAMYRRIIKPRQAELYAFIKSRFNGKLLMHSCGAIRDIIPDLIEIGVDALNPVQISAHNMEPASLKKEFGDKITFWGGGIDTQKTLPTGTIAEIKAEVKRNVAAFKEGGGYLFSQVHNITPEIPLESVLAMFEAFHECRDY